jgi:hypothetical protein
MDRKDRAKKRRLAKLKARKLKDAPIENNTNEIKPLKDTPPKSLKRQKQNQPNKGKSISRWLKWLSPTSRFWTCVVLFLTLVGSWYAFSFRLSITPSNPLNSSDPFSTPFILKNDSLLWINIVNPYKCALNYVKTEKGVVFENCGTSLVKPSIPQLEAGEPTTFMLPIPINKIIGNAGNIVNADIEIDVSYFPAFLPSFKILEKHYRKRFTTYQSKDGTLQWGHKAKSELTTRAH